MPGTRSELGRYVFVSPMHSKWWSNDAKNALRRIGLLLPTGLANLEVCRAIGPITPGGWLGMLTLFLVGLCPMGRHPFVRLALGDLKPIRRLVFALRGVRCATGQPAFNDL